MHGPTRSGVSDRTGRYDVQAGYAVADFNNKQVMAGRTTTLNVR